MTIDINLLRPEKGGDIEAVRKSESRRCRQGNTVDEAVECDLAWRKKLHQMEMLKQQMNKTSKQIGAAKKTDPEASATNDLVAGYGELKAQFLETEAEVAQLEAKMKQLLNRIGNIVDPSVVASTDEALNPVLRTWPQPRPALPCSNGSVGKLRHYEIMAKLQCLNVTKGTEIAGHRGYFLMGDLVLLNQALIMFGLATLQKHNYKLVQPPFMLKREVMAETAELADFEETLYGIPMNAEKKDDLFLIATSEQPISALHRHETWHKSKLPLRYGGISTCFRKEAGAHGKDMRGIFRTHQFEKVEQFVYCTPENSSAEHQSMISISEEFYQALKLPYRVVSIVGGALNNAASLKYDLEAWFPGYGDYRELVSCSNCTDYQARALQTKLQPASHDDRDRQFVHMLNGTLCATERTMCCILENYQDDTGVKIPEVLIPYMGGKSYLEYPSEG